MRNILLLACLVIAFGLKAQENVLVDRVITKIGGKIILYSDIEEQFNYMRSQNPGLPEDARCYLLDQLLTQQLLVVQAELDSVIVSDEEVEAQLDARFNQILTMMGGDREQFKSYYGKSPEEMKNEQRANLTEQMTSQRMQTQIMGDINITPSEVKAFFKDIPQDSLPYFNAEVEVCEIVIFPEPNEKQKQIALEDLNDIRKRIVEGEDFGEMAKRYSEDRGSAVKGGELGPMARGTLVPEYEAAAYKLGNGEISQVIKSKFGYHLIQLNERRGNIIDTRHILIKPKITNEDLESSKGLLDSLRTEILNDSITFTYAVQKFSSEEVQSKGNAGCLVNAKSGDSYFETGDLSPEVYFAIDTMQIGDISAPFEYETPTGEKGYRIVKLRSQTQPHKANLKDDYSKIKNAALEQKKSVFLNEWVMERANKTFIYIGEPFSTCPNAEKWQSKQKSGLK